MVTKILVAILILVVVGLIITCNKKEHVCPYDGIARYIRIYDRTSGRYILDEKIKGHESIEFIEKVTGHSLKFIISSQTK
jgi:hypothetical protein